MGPAAAPVSPRDAGSCSRVPPTHDQSSPRQKREADSLPRVRQIRDRTGVFRRRREEFNRGEAVAFIGTILSTCYHLPWCKTDQRSTKKKTHNFIKQRWGILYENLFPCSYFRIHLELKRKTKGRGHRLAWLLAKLNWRALWYQLFMSWYLISPHES